VDSDWLVIQTGGGKRLVLESATGRLHYSSPDAEDLWLQAPIALSNGRVCLAPDSGQTILFDPATTQNLWTYSTSRVRGSTTLTGEMPRLFGGDGTLVVLLPRNVGFHLERLDPQTGEALWPLGLRVVREALEPEQMSFGKNAIAYVNRNVLQSRSLADGKLLWSRVLPGSAGPWRAVCAGDLVLAFPGGSKLRRTASSPFSTSRNRRVGTEPSGQRKARVPDGFSILCCDAKDGQLLQRLNFAGHFSEGTMRIQSHRLLVGAEEHAWVLKDASAGEKATK
jgi:hypothetical protein